MTINLRHHCKGHLWGSEQCTSSMGRCARSSQNSQIDALLSPTQQDLASADHDGSVGRHQSPCRSANMVVPFPFERIEVFDPVTEICLSPCPRQDSLVLRDDTRIIPRTRQQVASEPLLLTADDSNYTSLLTVDLEHPRVDMEHIGWRFANEGGSAHQSPTRRKRRARIVCP